MKKTNHILAISLIAMSLISFTSLNVSAGERKMSPEKILRVLDKDSDNKISKEEASKARKKTLSENFGKFDENGDGFIDEDELNSFFKKKQ